MSAHVTFIMSVLLSVWIRAAPTGRISLKFYIGYFYENLSRKSRFIKVGQKMGHFRRRPKYVLSLSAVLCRHKSALFQLDSIRLLEHPTRYKYYANVQECYVIRTFSILLLKHCSQATQSPSNSSEKLLFLGFSTRNAAIKGSSFGNDLAETVLWPSSLNFAINSIR
jgi:hypothetical protein